MKIVSWNVNGLRAVLKNSGKSLKDFLDGLEADIICLQETKAAKDQLESSSCIADGYTSYFSFCRVKGGYSGVVTFCRGSATPFQAEEGLTGALDGSTGVYKGAGLTRDGHTHFTSREEMLSFDSEGRAVITEHACAQESGGEGEGEGEGARLVVINVYCPMVDRDNVRADRLEYKLLFYSVLQDRCTALEQAGKRVVVAGDLNCSRQAIDSAYIQDTPALLHGSPEREWMKQFATSLPPPSPSSPTTLSLLIDTFRYLNPTHGKAYTCWSTLLGYRKTNYGTRIDYILCSAGLLPLLSRAEVWSHVQGSDHCPVMAEFGSLELRPSPKPPSLSSAVQRGRQSKLSAFLAPRLSRTEENVEGQSSRSEVKGLKLTASVTMRDTMGRTAAGKGVKRKVSEAHLPPSKLSRGSKKKATLNSFFNPASSSGSVATNDAPPSSQPGSDVINRKSETVPQPQSSPHSTELEPLGTEGSSTKKESSPPSSSTASPTASSSTASSSSQLSRDWLSVFSGPPRPPSCKGHNEPATLRTVRKAGPNRGRQFWVCSRPGGSKGDPTTQCDFFQWLTRVKPTKSSS